MVKGKPELLLRSPKQGPSSLSSSDPQTSLFNQPPISAQGLSQLHRPAPTPTHSGCKMRAPESSRKHSRCLRAHSVPRPPLTKPRAPGHLHLAPHDENDNKGFCGLYLSLNPKPHFKLLWTECLCSLPSKKSDVDTLTPRAAACWRRGLSGSDYS